jgi:uncharacterized membrane protein YgcG
LDKAPLSRRLPLIHPSLHFLVPLASTVALLSLCLLVCALPCLVCCRMRTVCAVWAVVVILLALALNSVHIEAAHTHSSRSGASSSSSGGGHRFGARAKAAPGAHSTKPTVRDFYEVREP